MQIKMAECAGFCFGVKRAVDMVNQQIGTCEKIYTYGPIVHNEEVVRELEEKGVSVIHNKEELMSLPQEERGKVIIRAHGVSKEFYELVAQKNMECVDATCPFVKRIHRIVERESSNGKFIVIVGNAGHPEVEGIRGWCFSDNVVIGGPEEAREAEIPMDREICIVSQTTFNNNKFQDTVEIIQKKGYNASVVNTICDATEERQRAARLLAQEADVMIVIGGEHSSNTKKLYDICLEECADTYFIQTLDDLHLELPKAVGLVGITAGASTPNKLIEEVQNYVRINF